MFNSMWWSKSLTSSQSTQKINSSKWRQTTASILLIFSVAAGLTSLSPTRVNAKASTEALPNAVSQSLVTISTSRLPVQAQEMLTLIYQGGPFRYDKDGVVFGNRERILPAKERGFYREYTVRTPAERSRGARRIVCGGLKPTAPDACFYTDDHYASFRKIVQ